MTKCIERLSTCAALTLLMGMAGSAQTPAARFGAPWPPANAAPTVRARCEPCTIEIGKTTTIMADAQDKSGARLTYKWSAPTGTFADAAAPQTEWTAPMRRQWSDERWKKEGPNGVTLTVMVDDGRGGTASATVTVLVTRPAAKK